MGRIEKPAAEKATESEVEEDTPIVKELKELDDKYLALEQEYEREVQKLQVEFTKRQLPLLEERKKTLCAPGEGGDAASGTPALQGFWMKALQNHPAFESLIQEWDEPVLEYLQDVEKSPVDETDGNAGFHLVFKFAENPFFEETELKKEYKSEVSNPYCGEIKILSVTCSPITWKAGKNVTVEMVAKKVKGGGAKKAKQKQPKEEPRESFFRDFFRDLSREMKLSDDAREMARSLAEEESDEEDDNDDEAMIEYLLENDHEIGTALRDQIIPFAVRWYTGEAAPDDDDDDDEDEEEEEDDSEDESDSEDEPPRRGAKAKGGAKRGPEAKPNEAPKEECKQQ